MPFNEDGPEWEFLRQWCHLTDDERQFVIDDETWLPWEREHSRYYSDAEGRVFLVDCHPRAQ